MAWRASRGVPASCKLQRLHSQVWPRIATRPLPRAERRQVILTGAARAFAAGGFDATSMEDIAEAAGVTKLIVYRHFESKEELYRAILEEVSGRLRAEVESMPGRVSAGACSGRVPDGGPGGSRRLPASVAPLVARAAASPSMPTGCVRPSVAVARRLLRPRVGPSLLAWAAPMSVDFLVEAVLNWLDSGTPGEDERFLDVVSRSLAGLIEIWAG